MLGLELHGKASACGAWEVRGDLQHVLDSAGKFAHVDVMSRMKSEKVISKRILHKSVNVNSLWRILDDERHCLRKFEMLHCALSHKSSIALRTCVLVHYVGMYRHTYVQTSDTWYHAYHVSNLSTLPTSESNT